MERVQPEWGMNWVKYTAVISLYEFIGTFLLVAIINSTGGSAVAIGLGLFFLLNLGGAVTGAHYNPAVTIGVLINRTFCVDNNKNSFFKNLAQACCMIFSQVVGACLGACMIYHLIENSKVSNSKRAAQFPHLMPRGITWIQGFFIEFTAAFIFTMVNLICKDGERLQFAASKIANEGFFAVLTIAMTLCAMIFVAGPHTGAAINPAVAVANHGMSVALFQKNTVHDDIVCTYGFSGVIGGLAAGFFSWAHGSLVQYSVDAHKATDTDIEAPEAVEAPTTAA
jgi:glycerol uptake facilitator-like aquaporin